jgi:hypothetical protein
MRSAALAAMVLALALAALVAPAAARGTSPNAQCFLADDR